MWPTDEIGVTQTKDAALLARAKQTVFGLNQYQKKPWANTNGFCLSWPPAVRVSERSDAEVLLSSFATAITSTTGHNGCVHNNGGMLENIGATVAINDLLLQSHGGRLRFFPVWNATALGAASFKTLRAYGALLVSGEVDASGLVAPVSLESEVGGEVVFDSPWPAAAAAPKVTDASGAAVPMTKVGESYSFVSKAQGKYTISSAK
jgi:alpha-L-fucosidase 2